MGNGLNESGEDFIGTRVAVALSLFLMLPA